MREIKFRAWSERRKTMHDWHYLLCSYSADSLFNRPKDFDLIMQQFAGLKDKNGKDVFEGDRVKTFIYAEREEAVGEVVFDKDNTGFGLEIKGNFWRWPEIESQDFEVIGNIYENPELLESSENK